MSRVLQTRFHYALPNGMNKSPSALEMPLSSSDCACLPRGPMPVEVHGHPAIGEHVRPDLPPLLIPGDDFPAYSRNVLISPKALIVLLHFILCPSSQSSSPSCMIF